MENEKAIFAADPVTGIEAPLWPLIDGVSARWAAREAIAIGAAPCGYGAFADRLPHMALRREVAAVRRRGARSIHDFRVPRHYLSCITGAEWADHALASEMTGQKSTIPADHISSVDFVRLSQLYMRTADGEARAGEGRSPIGTFNLVVAVAAQAADLADALRRMVEAIDIVRPDLVATLSRGRRTLSLSVAPRAGGTADAEVGAEYFVVALHCALRWLSGDRLRPSFVRSARDQPGHPSPLLRILCCPLTRSGTGATVEYPLAGSDRPFPLQRTGAGEARELSEFFKLLEEAVTDLAPSKPRTAHDIVARIEAMLQGGVKGEPNIAARLGLSTASLRRRMTEIGISYRQVLERFRREQVGRLLQSERPLADVALEAGFADVRSLRKVCIKWFGSPPGQLRKEGLAGVARSQNR